VKLTASESLAQLPSRFDAIQWIERMIAQQEPETDKFAVLLVRVRDLRQINAGFGYGTGDRLLTSVAQSLAYVKREQDLLARVGNSEFVLLLPRITGEGLVTLAVTKILHRFKEPVALGESNIRVDAVIGVALWPDHGGSAAGLMHAADRSLQQAIERGDRWRVFSRQDQDPHELCWTIAQELGQALQNEELELYFQPQIDLRSSLPSGAEAVARWRHPRRGLLLPEEFLPSVAQGALMDAFNWWTLRNALRAAGEIRDTCRGCDISVSFPLSTVLQESFVELLADELRFWNVPDGALRLELTENGDAMQSDVFAQVAQELEDIDVQTVLDRFGSGCQSPSILRRTQPQRIKIHGLLVRDVLRSERDQIIVRALIHLARELAIQVVAEGADDAETLSALREWGCDFAQGLYIAPAMPKDAFLSWLSAQG